MAEVNMPAKDNMWEKIVVSFSNVEDLVVQLSKERDTTNADERAKMTAVLMAANETFSSLIQLRIAFKKNT